MQNNHPNETERRENSLKQSHKTDYMTWKNSNQTFAYQFITLKNINNTCKKV